MVKIAIIGSRGVPATFGGVEKHCEELYSRLVTNSYQVVIYSRNYYNKDNLTKYKGIDIFNIPVMNIKGVEAFIHCFISSILASFSNADIIHYHAQGPVLFAVIPRIFSPKKIIAFTCHGVDWQRDKWNFIASFVIRSGEYISSKIPHIKIAVSQYLVDYYKDKYNITPNKIYNGVTVLPKIKSGKVLDQFNLIEKQYLIFVGRLVPEKAPEIAIKAFQNLNTDKKLVIVGGAAKTDSYLKQLQDIANNDHRIIFTDFLYAQDLQELYSSALAYISSSRLEGLPITVLEAMSYSLPVILSDIGPHKEVLEFEEFAGFNFKTNDIQDCAEKIEKVFSLSLEEIEIIGNNAKLIVEKHFIWDSIAHETSRLYEISLNIK
ncbi:MAG: glycosyltransferase family 4 protein [Cyanobacteriota bacterium]